MRPLLVPEGKVWGAWVLGRKLHVFHTATTFPSRLNQETSESKETQTLKPQTRNPKPKP